MWHAVDFGAPSACLTQSREDRTIDLNEYAAVAALYPRRASARNPTDIQVKDTERTERNRDHREMPGCGRRAGCSSMNFSLCSHSFSVASVSCHLDDPTYTQKRVC